MIINFCSFKFKSVLLIEFLTLINIVNKVSAIFNLIFNQKKENPSIWFFVPLKIY